jgi:hypothetical protein
MGNVKTNTTLHSHPHYFAMRKLFLIKQWLSEQLCFKHEKAWNIELVKWSRTYLARCPPKPPDSEQFTILCQVPWTGRYLELCQVPLYGLNCIFPPAVPHWSHSLRTPLKLCWSWHSSVGIATGWKAGVQFPEAAKKILFSTAFTPVLGSTLAYSMSTRVKRTGREAHQSSNVEVKNGGATDPLPIFSWRGA